MKNHLDELKESIPKEELKNSELGTNKNSEIGRLIERAIPSSKPPRETLKEAFEEFVKQSIEEQKDRQKIRVYVLSILGIALLILLFWVWRFITCNYYKFNEHSVQVLSIFVTGVFVNFIGLLAIGFKYLFSVEEILLKSITQLFHNLVEDTKKEEASSSRSS